jgi:Zn-dependent M28 family amino/carboxypeptidase
MESFNTKKKYFKYKLKYLNLKRQLGGSISMDNIKYLTKNISIPRQIESTNLQLVKKFVTDKLKELNLSVEEQKFSEIVRGTSFNFSNIIAYNQKSKKKYILLAAHIDSCNIENFEGAIDSASSIAIIIEIAKKLLKIDENYPLMITFFDGEEAIKGTFSDDNTLIGSKYFVNNYDISNIEQLYLLDLIGGTLENKINAFKDNLLSLKQIELLSNINKKYNYQIFTSPSINIEEKERKDDHLPFKEKGVKYLHLIPTPFPKQHHLLTDNYENLNWKYIEIFTKVLFEYLSLNSN